jgi:aspartyl protease family protein
MGKCEISVADQNLTFSVKLNENNAFVVDVEVNGITGVFLIDTGASITSITSDFARKTKINLGDAQDVVLNGIGGVVKGKIAAVSAAKIGPFSVGNFDIAVLDAEAGPLAHDGLLGMNLLSRFKIMTDADVIYIKSP